MKLTKEGLKAKEEWINKDQLRFQAYSALAFGAEVITWGCYTAGWWYNQVLDEFGEKTEQYPKLQQVNAELHAIGSEYIKFRNTTTYFIGFSENDLIGVSQAPVETLNTGVFHNVFSENGSPVLAGQMVAKDESRRQALFLCNAADPYGKCPLESTIVFSTDGHRVKLFSSAGEKILEPDEEGRYRIEIPSSQGVLVTAL